jgi:FemAB-related protein (PEP-CTERM system-associated)
MQIELLKDSEREKWDRYVMDSEGATAYHLTGWKDIVEKGFGHRTYYLIAKENENVVGILPLVFMKSLFFGRFLVSLPFFNYGGICAKSLDIEQALLAEAIALARRETASHIELRHAERGELGLPAKTAKVAMVLDLPSSPEELWQGFKAKLRNQIRRAEREGMEVQYAGLEAVDEFYKVFAANMRDLGTPVYSKAFFIDILQTFPKATQIVTVFHQKQPVASGFLVEFKERVEIPWASSLRKYNALAPNMLLYWHALKFSCESGYRQFDFGRCTLHSTTYKFKEQWGAKPIQLYWHYWLSDGHPLPELSPSNPKFTLAIQLWKRLPLLLTKFLGPKIVKNIP